MKIYGFEIENSKLTEAIKEAEIESIKCNRIEYLVVLDTETGELYQWSRPCGSSNVTQRIWDGTDRVLYTTSNQFFDVFRDWLAAGYSEDEMNEFVKAVVGDEVYAQYAEQKADDEDEDPIWEMIWTDGSYCDELREAVVEQFESELLETLDMDAIFEHIEEEVNRPW